MAFFVAHRHQLKSADLCNGVTSPTAAHSRSGNEYSRVDPGGQPGRWGLMGRWDRARDRYFVALVANVMTSLLQNLQGPFHILLFDQ